MDNGHDWGHGGLMYLLAADTRCHGRAKITKSSTVEHETDRQHERQKSRE